MSPDPRPESTGGEYQPPGDGPPRWRRAVVGFGHFWWDFLVGDTPELLLGSLLAVAAAALLVHGAGVRSVAMVALPVLVVTILVVSSLRARARARRSGPHPGG